jgi:hypothetical protein
VKNKGIFFCCGEDYEDKYEVDDSEDPRKPFKNKDEKFGKELKNTKPQV